MHPMKRPGTALLLLTGICISGCAPALAPHAALNQAVARSFEATGFNYSSKSRITHLSIPKQPAGAASTDRRTKYLDTGLDTLRALSVNAEGAIDLQAKRSEALYDLRYDRDNVEVSIKLPLLIDYNTQTMYVGTSLLTTLLETVYPQAPSTRGRLIRIQLSDLLQEGTANSPELSKLVGEYLFSPRNIDVMGGAVRSVILKSLAKLDESCFSDQPLGGQDRKAGVERRIQVALGHADAVTTVLDLIDDVSRALFQEGVITKDEYDALLARMDRRTLEGIADTFSMAMILDVGIGPSGLVSQVESRLNAADREGLYQLGLNNLSSFSSYNAPRFSLHPETGGSVDFKELLGAITAAAATEQSDPPSDTDAHDDSEITTGALP